MRTALSSCGPLCSRRLALTGVVVLAVFALLPDLAAVEANQPPRGFVALFNGEDLSGWQGLLEGGRPNKILALSPQERAEKQRAADEQMRKHWKVEDGQIVNPDGKGIYLETARDYGDFELLLDWKIAPGTDSGIYLRGTPQVQIWDPVAGIPAAKVGSGGLYNNKKGPSLPLVKADKPAGEWNTFRILMVDDVVNIWLNGQLVVAETRLENYWDRKKRLAPVGTIQLQTHGGELRFRNLFIREIPRRPPESGVLDKAGRPVGPGWKPLFTDSLDGWKHEPEYWKLEEGVLRGQTDGDPEHHYAWNETDYSDFELHAMVKLSGEKANSGICVRMQPTSFDDGPGYQVDMGEGYWGSLWEERRDGPVAMYPEQLASKVVRKDDWNHYYVVARGDHITGWLNGVRTFEAIHPRGLKSGKIGMQICHGEDRKFTCEFKDVWVREIGAESHIDFEPPREHAGFTPLFNGENLDGWIGNTGGYAAENGLLVCKKTGGGNLYTAGLYKDFVLRFQFKLQSGANNGLGIRALYLPPRGDYAARFFDGAYSGMELQILENTAKGYRDLAPYQYHGSVYGVSAAHRGYQRPVGYWNYQEVRVEGSRITVHLNGVRITDVDIRKAGLPQTLDKRPHDGLFNQFGYIGFLGHGHRIEFRDLQIRELRPLKKKKN